MSKPSTPAERGTDPHVLVSLDRSPARVVGDLLDDARDSVDVVQYKFTDSEILGSLEGLLDRGARVRLLLDGHEAAKEKSLWRRAASKGAQVREWPSEEAGKLHAKFMVIDGRMALVGSSNWTRKGSEENVEVLIHLRDPSSVSACRSVFERLWSLARPAGEEDS